MQFLRPGLPITPEQVSAFEQEFQLQLPEQYQQYLITQRGGVPDADWCNFVSADASFTGSVAWIYPILNSDGYRSLWAKNMDFKGRIPKGFVACAGCESGNQYCIDARPGSKDYGAVFYWTHDIDTEDHLGNSNSHLQVQKVAAGFSEFLAGLIAVNDED